MTTLKCGATSVLSLAIYRIMVGALTYLSGDGCKYAPNYTLLFFFSLLKMLA